jgi:hypothetical protein
MDILGNEFEDKIVFYHRHIFDIVEILENNPQLEAADLFQKSLNYLISKKEVDFWIDYVFYQIDQQLEAKKDKAEKDKKLGKSALVSLQINALRFTMIYHFKGQILDEIKDLDLIGQRRWLKDNFSENKFRPESYFNLALLEIQSKVTKQIDAQIEDSELRQQIASSESQSGLSKDTSKEKKDAKTKYPLSCKTNIFNAAVRLSETRDKWNKLDLAGELGVSESTVNRQMDYFKLSMRMIRDEALTTIRKKQYSQT